MPTILGCFGGREKKERDRRREREREIEKKGNACIQGPITITRNGFSQVEKRYFLIISYYAPPHRNIYMKIKTISSTKKKVQLFFTFEFHAASGIREVEKSTFFW
jgi:hypothetical protein